MIARLWWKEARQVWPIWAFLAGLGLFWINLLRWYVNAESGPRVVLVGQAVIITFVYMFLIGAAVFAGERENRTLGLLDALPVERWRVWIAKATFAAATTTALGALLALAALALEGPPPAAGRDLVAFLLLCGFGWSLFWSALSGNALLAAALGMGSLALTFAQVNWGSNQLFLAVESSPTAWHWLFALALIPASAAILQLGGPPQRSWLGSRSRPRPAPVEPLKPLEPSKTRLGGWRAPLVWPASVSKLVWLGLRETLPVWWPAAVLGIAVPLAFSWNDPMGAPGYAAIAGLFVSLVLGANIFNAENRGGTQRFLVHHGARPGLVWLIKLLVGLAAITPIWLALIALGAAGWRAEGSWRPPEGGLSLLMLAWVVLSVVGVVVGAFAAGAWCGMVFRRGITAALVSLVFWLVVCAPPILLAVGLLMWPPYLVWVPVAILAVTWAWSGDWLLDRPGVGRWVRLGVYSTAAAVGLASAYVADRIWSVPAIGPTEHAAIFQFDRIAGPAHPAENAAEIYRDPSLFIMSYPPIKALAPIIFDAPDADWDAKNPDLLAWQRANEAKLKKLREAAAMPVCRFQDLRKMTAFSSERGEPGSPYPFSRALATSSRIRFAQGDPLGSWEDIETLLRMGRQFSGLNPEWARRHGYELERVGLSLAFRWVSDPRRTLEMLENARDSYRALPPPASLADLIRADALMVHNTINMPREDLVRAMLDMETARGNKSPLVKPWLDATTTPWELARFQRVYDLIAAGRVQVAERQRARPVFTGPLELPPFPVVIGEGANMTIVNTDDLEVMAAITPLTSMPMRGLVPPARVPIDENLVDRRALDVILSLRVYQARRGDGGLPPTLEVLVEADPGVANSLIDPHAGPRTRFGYVHSEGQRLATLQPLRDDSLAKRNDLLPAHNYKLLYSVGPDGKDDHALRQFNYRDGGDFIFPIKNDVPAPDGD